MERLLRRGLFVSVGYALGWFLNGWPFVAACLFSSVVMANLHMRGIIPDSRLRVLDALPPEDRCEAQKAGLKVGIGYGFLYFLALGCFAGWVKEFLFR